MLSAEDGKSFRIGYEMKFQKGHKKIPGAGRPVGSKDKVWSSLDYWYGLVINEWPDLKAVERATIAISAWKALVARDKTPLTPMDSVKNAEAAMNALKMLEEAARNVVNRGTGAGCDPVGVVNGTAKLQNEGSATPRL
jgi:hypothetical protein